MESARHPHHFVGIDQDGRTTVVATRGNPHGHIVLRGGRRGPNYDPVSIAQAEEQLEAAGLPPRIVVDCSHANSGKRYPLQRHVVRSVVQQRLDGDDHILGFMLESNLVEGSQKLADNPTDLAYGVSITDPCIGWDMTERLLRFAHRELSTGPREGV